MTSAEATTSKEASGKGSACAFASSELCPLSDRLAPCVLDLRFRWVHGEHRRGRARVEDQLRENASAAADVEPARIRRRSAQCRKIWPRARLQRPMNCS